ncbi:hypothetical protein ACFQ64_16365 [Streptomyces sp. NPDC056460]|uniref:hypothetical protein n=1 Tax=Streptomyces sp. NPDC056460 TaxID=3345825 RepID=UPI00367565A8
MQASHHRRELERKNRARADADKKVAEYRKKEADKRTAASKARAAAAKSKNASTVNSKLSEAGRLEKQASDAAGNVAAWSAKAARFGREAAGAEARLAQAEASERLAAERARQREAKDAERRATAESRKVNSRLAATEDQVATVLRVLRAPKPEKLRVLMLGAASAGDLRVGREQARIRSSVERSLHRDHVELDAYPAATADHLLDGLTRFRPHVVHFSGHSDTDLIFFEKDIDPAHAGAVVTARAFASAIKAAPEPPLLVLLNACRSAAQLPDLVEVVPFAIGMADEIDDTDAITYAARFYASVADGQSIEVAHEMSRAKLHLDGLPGHELPTLECAADVDAAAAFLVKPPQ